MTRTTFDPATFAPAPDPTGGGYVYGDPLIRAVRVALAINRPLLLRGAPGSGKTTLARSVARELGADYYQEVVTSRTEARDLEWRFDALRRLADTHITQHENRVAQPGNYVTAQALWWGFDPTSAATQGDPAGADPLAASGGSSATRPAVVLVDEIDKAEPEVANDLLEPFDTHRFTVAETGQPVQQARPVFLVVTTNDERDLPSAFLRRCVVHELPRPSADTLARIARSQLGTALDDPGVQQMIARMDALAADASLLRLRAPGTAEFLDALRALAALAPVTADERDAVARLALWKHRSREDRP